MSLQKGLNWVSFSNDSKTAVTSSKDQTLRIWNLDGKLCSSFQCLELYLFYYDGILRFLIYPKYVLYLQR
jgi:WD40 repeat protein